METLIGQRSFYSGMIKKASILLICLFSVLHATPIKTTVRSPAVHGDFGINGGTIDIFWDEPVTFETRKEQRELYILTDRPFTNPDFDIVGKEGDFLFKEISFGYNGLLLTTFQPVEFFVQTIGPHNNGIRITVVISGPPDSRPLDYAKGRLFLEEKRFSEAFYFLYELQKQFPRYDQIEGLIGIAESGVKNWMCALDHLAEANFLAPYDEEYIDSFSQIYYPHSSFVGFEREMERIETVSIEHYWRVHAEYFFLRSACRAFYAGLDLEMNRAHISQYINNEGFITGFLGDRYRGRVYLRSECCLGSVWEFSAYGGEGAFGLGGLYEIKFDQGQFHVLAEWNRPYWDYLETLVNHGVRHRLFARADAVYNWRWRGGLGVGISQFGTEKYKGAVLTLPLQADLYYTVRSICPIVLLHYNLLAEYQLRNESEINSAGDIFQPVPFFPYENHAFRIDVVYDTKWLKMESFVGVVVNPMGQTAYRDFTLGLNVTARLTCSLELDLNAYVYPSTSVQGQRQEVLGGGLKWRF